ncbi:MAG: molybdopterin molybdotransferase MoeA [Rhodomicrobium sp.]
MTLMTVAGVKARILNGVEALGGETVSLYEAGNRVLAEDLKARLTQPPFDASAMDGYAVRTGDVASVPVSLKVIGSSAAGHGFAGKVGPMEAVRIFTGAPLPEDAGTIVIQENTQAAPAGEIAILEGAPEGKHIRPRGYDFKEGEALLPAGTRLGSRHLMLAAAMNHASVAVRRKPVIAVLANGDELVSPGSAPKACQIVSSIPAGMKAAIEAWGGEALLLELARDTKESIAARAAAGERADVLLTIGGASVGEHDLVRSALEERGARFEVLKAAMRPGKPVMFGFMGEQRVLSLPGNPASAIICARVFLKPLISALLGLDTAEPLRQLPLAHAIGANGEREHYMRAVICGSAIAPIADQDSSLMKAFATSDCLLVRPVQAPPLPAGALVPTLSLDF